MRTLILTLLSFISMGALSDGRSEVSLTQWQFSRDKTSWQEVTVPHDWAIDGPFDKKWDLQSVAIVQNGETQATEKSGRSGALPWIGEGYYKTNIRIDNLPEHAELVFDGAMSEPTVSVNGKKAGYWAYGYNAFRIDVTQYLHAGDNLIEVSLKNVEESSRWYPGGGIYRPVKLVTTSKAHLDAWGTYIRTLQADSNQAILSVDTKTIGGEGKVNIRIYDASGAEVANGNTPFVKSPHLWTPETPYLYTAVIELLQQNVVVDKLTQKFGIRTIAITPERGFMLNGISRKFKGVCLHHDLGPLGAAVNRAAIERQVRILKDMGCDAIRTSHNMPSTMQLEVCDSMGMMVMAESFDMWIYPKCKNGYARFFNEWSDRDMENLVLRSRNHPSIVMWSIGNEIPEQWNEEGREISRRLQDICHRLDPSRPVTQGMDRADGATKTGFMQVMDVPGFNYRVHLYDEYISQLPQKFILGSETGSTISSRGVYYFPVEVTDHPYHDDGQCSSYDIEYCWWSNLPDDDFMLNDDRNYTIGQFVWTGFDYLGEPTPYDEYWPSRSSYFGICDLAGLPKDRYYLYRSVWNTSEHTIHLLPHWTWPGREGQTTPVYCYTDYPEAELFVNGKSQGRIRKNTSARNVICNPNAEKKDLTALDRYRLRWNDVVYEPGELRVVVFDEQGNRAGEQVLRTAGKPLAMKLEADRKVIKADGSDLAYITVSLTDKNGTEIPTATDQLSFDVSGAGKFRGVCNGDATSLQPFTKPEMKLFSGKLVVTVQASDTKGEIKLTVRDKDHPKLKNSIIINAK
ncbi:MAG: DUF4982 domain-containing protein [Prevotella sp.]|nr:DUF4982 domain-containing protein [Prevotella sp.]